MKHLQTKQIHIFGTRRVQDVIKLHSSLLASLLTYVRITSLHVINVG